MWKNGQIVTISGKKYRVKSAPCGHFPCDHCALDCDDSIECDSLCFLEENKLDGNQYLEELLCGKKTKK